MARLYDAWLLISIVWNYITIIHYFIDHILLENNDLYQYMIYGSYLKKKQI